MKKELVLIAVALVLASTSLGLSAYAVFSEPGSVQREIPAAPEETRAVVIEPLQVEEGFTAIELIPGKILTVQGVVTQVEDDYVSRSGRAYEQFEIKTGNQSIPVFTAIGSGTGIRPQEGETVTLQGKVEEHEGTRQLVDVRRV